MTCKINNCNKEIVCRLMCSAHYTKWQRYGDPEYVRELKKEKPCIAENCERKQHAKGYCCTHYRKMERSGTLERLVFSEEWKRKQKESKKNELAKLDSTPDTGIRRRGHLAVNTVADIRHKAIKRGLEWGLSRIEAYNLIIADCNYCGKNPNWPQGRNGIDRVDNTKGYNPDNCVSCCFICNSAKGTQSLEEFISWITAVYNKIHKSTS